MTIIQLGPETHNYGTLFGLSKRTREDPTLKVRDLRLEIGWLLGLLSNLLRLPTHSIVLSRNSRAFRRRQMKGSHRREIALRDRFFQSNRGKYFHKSIRSAPNQEQITRATKGDNMSGELRSVGSRTD